VDSMSSMQKEYSVEGKYNVGSPLSKAVIQKIMMKYGMCM